MKGFRKGRKMDPLGRQLHESRPTPSGELLESIVSRIEDSRPRARTHARFRRFVPAAVAAATILVVLAVFGGAGFAASGVVGAASSTGDAIGALVTAEQSSGQDNQGGSDGERGQNNCNTQDDSVAAARGQYCKQRQTICHVTRGGSQTLTLPVKAAARHLRNHQNDYDGPCRPNGGDD